jgi:hypothetical protein
MASQASHPEDKVYRLLSLSSDSHALSVKPNHKKTVLEVYTGLVQLGLVVSIFGLCGRKVGTETLQLPSWMPDPSDCAMVNTCYYHDRKYKAGTKYPSEFGLCSQAGALKAKGLVLDMIQVTSSDPRHHYLEFLNNWDDPHVAHQAQEEAFRRLPEMQRLFRLHVLRENKDQKEQELPCWSTLAEGFGDIAFEDAESLGDSILGVVAYTYRLVEVLSGPVATSENISAI